MIGFLTSQLSPHAHLFEGGHDQAHIVQVSHLPVQAGHGILHVHLERLHGHHAPMDCWLPARLTAVRACQELLLS